MEHPKKGAYTLIELLVVLAIIGLLSSVVIAALNTARARGRDAAIKSEVLELRTNFLLEYNDNGSYMALKAAPPSPFWISTGAQCNNIGDTTNFTGNYAASSEAICSVIIANEAAACPASGVDCLYLYNVAPLTSKNFSIMAYLPGANSLMCLGSNGRESVTLWGTVNQYTYPGCIGDTTL